MDREFIIDRIEEFIEWYYDVDYLGKHDMYMFLIYFLDFCMQNGFIFYSEYEDYKLLISSIK